MNWLFRSTTGLWIRIFIGVAIFITLGVCDYRRNGPRATRWKEYTVLLAAVAAALLYGAINDQITSMISWEYFYYGKDLEHILGPAVPPDPLALHLQAALVGLKATWSAGLIFGVILLLANNPWRDLPRLANHQLIHLLPLVLLTAAALAILGGILGYAGALTPLSADFQDMTRANEFRPNHFMCTWGIHLGGYVGGFLGTLRAAASIMRKRQSAASPQQSAPAS